MSGQQKYLDTLAKMHRHKASGCGYQANNKSVVVYTTSGRWNVGTNKAGQQPAKPGTARHDALMLRTKQFDLGD